MNPNDIISARIWRFGPAELDERDLVLRVDGEAASLERKSKEVLLCLLEHAGEVVTKDELLGAVWSGRVSSDAALAKCISRIRSALGESGRALIQTVHGYGYRLTGMVSIEKAARGSEARLDFQPGDHPPLRPAWELLRVLGGGGHGEVWLARHRETHEQRVFKFALDSPSLGALKREITLYRVLQEGTGEQARCLGILSWNLEVAPYFIECEFIAGGNLTQWVASRGGWAQISLQERLKIMADIAEAISWAHSAGVIHKDLKPGNVLVETINDQAQIRLADFGSGAVSRDQLSRLGITQHGFTRSVGLDEDSAGTIMYMPPESLAGQVPTVRADIYALGVMLYQMVIGDFNRPLVAGWEEDISDDLLRRDIAAAANGQLLRRLADAGQLADNLRRLQERHQAEESQRRQQQRQLRAQAMRVELKRWRIAASTMLGLLVVATAAGLLAYQARSEALQAEQQALLARDQAITERSRADQAAQTMQAVSDFMNDELLGGVQWSDETTEISLNAMLAQVASRIDERLGKHPDAAAEVHFVVGMRYGMSGDTDTAAEHWAMALAILQQTYGEDSIQTVRARHLNGLIHAIAGDFENSRVHFQKSVSILKRERGPAHLMTLYERSQVAEVDIYAGFANRALSELQAIAQLAPGAPPLDDYDAKLFAKFGEGSEGAAVQVSLGQKLATVAHEKMGILHTRFRHIKEADHHLQLAMHGYKEMYGEDTRTSLEAAVNLIEIRAFQQRFEEAEKLADKVRDEMTGPASAENITGLIVLHRRARIRMEQQRYEEAISLLRKAWDLCPSAPEQGCFYAESSDIPVMLADALLEVGRFAEARDLYQRALSTRSAGNRSDDIWLLPIQLGLAEAQLGLNNTQAAAAILTKAATVVDQRPEVDVFFKADFYRVQGRLLTAQGSQQATSQLDMAEQLTATIYGPSHWRVARIEQAKP